MYVARTELVDFHWLPSSTADSGLRNRQDSDDSGLDSMEHCVPCVICLSLTQAWKFRPSKGKRHKIQAYQKGGMAWKCLGWPGNVWDGMKFRPSLEWHKMQAQLGMTWKCRSSYGGMKMQAQLWRHGKVGLVMAAWKCRLSYGGMKMQAQLCWHGNVGLVMVAWKCRPSHGGMEMQIQLWWHKNVGLVGDDMKMLAQLWCHG